MQPGGYLVRVLEYQGSVMTYGLNDVVNELLCFVDLLLRISHN